MTKLLTSPKTDLAKYTGLRQRVRAVLAAGRQRAVAAVEYEKVKTSWEAGKLILEHILLNKKRADYGARVTNRNFNSISLYSRRSI